MKGKTIAILLVVSVILHSSTVSAETDTRIMFIGDSVTRGEIGESYVESLVAIGSPWNQTWVNITNNAENGQAVASYYEAYEPENYVQSSISDYEPHYLFIMLGLADLGYYADAKRYQTQFTWLLETIMDQTSNLQQIFILEMSWVKDRPESQMDLVEEYLQVQANLSKTYDLQLVKVYEHVENHPEYLIDHVHLSQLGADAMASIVHDATASMIKQVEATTENMSMFYGLLAIPLLGFAKKRRDD